MLAIDIQHFDHSAGKEFGSNIHLLLAGMSKVRLASPASLMFSPHLIESSDLVNIVMAIAGLPSEYQGRCKVSYEGTTTA